MLLLNLGDCQGVSGTQEGRGGGGLAGEHIPECQPLSYDVDGL